MESMRCRFQAATLCLTCCRRLVLTRHRSRRRTQRSEARTIVDTVAAVTAAQDAATAVIGGEATRRTRHARRSIRLLCALTDPNRTGNWGKRLVTSHGACEQWRRRKQRSCCHVRICPWPASRLARAMWPRTSPVRWRRGAGRGTDPRGGHDTSRACQIPAVAAVVHTRTGAGAGGHIVKAAGTDSPGWPRRSWWTS